MTLSFTAAPARNRRNDADRAALCHQVATELAAVAGLTITPAQIARLCGLPPDVGHRVALELVNSGILYRLDPAEGPGGGRSILGSETFALRPESLDERA